MSIITAFLLAITIVFLSIGICILMILGGQKKPVLTSIIIITIMVFVVTALLLKYF